MNQKIAFRRKKQLEWLNSGVNLEVGAAGACPLKASQLAQLQFEPLQMQLVCDTGQTAQIYQLSDGAQKWCLKKARHRDWHGNIDGQLSFLNELQRRQDFAQLQRNIKYQHQLDALVPTQYASLQDGFILMPWVEGQPIQQFDETTLQQVFDLLTHLELEGFFEWDLSSGNWLYDTETEQIRLLDYGYMYRFNPMTEFNCNGVAEPMFHSVERFEARFFFAHLLQLERHNTETQLLRLYELEKRLALQAYQRKSVLLKQRFASGEVLAWLDDIMLGWQAALRDPARLSDLYLLESFRANVLDVNDALYGNRCSEQTLYRLEKIINLVNEHFSLLKLQKGLMFEDACCSKQQLLQNYRAKLQQAQQHQH